MSRLDSFEINKSLASALGLLTVVEAGSLVKSMCDYYFRKEDNIPTGNAAFLWGLVKDDFDRQKDGVFYGD